MITPCFCSAGPRVFCGDPRHFRPFSKNPRVSATMRRSLTYKLVVTTRRRSQTGRTSMPSLQSFEENRVSVYDKLKALNITLPQVSTPAAAYVPYVRTGNLLFLSGHIARKDGKPLTGQLGGNLTTEQGKEAARAIAIDLMATLQSALGDLKDQAHRQADGFSQLHARVHRTASGRQRRLRTFSRGFWRKRAARPQRLRRGPDSTGFLRGNRADRRSGVRLSRRGIQ